MDQFRKTPREERSFEVDYEDDLVTGDSLVSVALSAINNETGVTDNTVLQSTTGTVSGYKGLGEVIGGTAGQAFIVRALATTANGEKIEKQMLWVIDDYA